MVCGPSYMAPRAGETEMPRVDWKKHLGERISFEEIRECFPEVVVFE